MKILLTGLTSFTGAHIAHQLEKSGHEVYGTLTKDMSEYNDPLIKQRLVFTSGVKLIPNCTFGSENLIKKITEIRPQIYINHGGQFKGYRNPDFDIQKHLDINTFNGLKMFQALKECGVQKIIHTGTFFEPNEDEPALSAYGQCKFEIWNRLLSYARECQINISKILISNPIGPYENEDRLIPSFVKKWTAGELPTISQPYLIRDNIPVTWLAKFYAKTIESENTELIYSPSGFIHSNLDFLALFLGKLFHYRPHSFGLNILPSKPAEPFYKANKEPLKEINDPASVDIFFKSWFEYLRLVNTN